MLEKENRNIRRRMKSAHRYLFNSMENDPEVSGLGNSYTTEFRQYDPRLGRWKSLDPLMMMFPDQSPYNGFGNNPIFFVDPFGLEPSNGDDGGGDDGKAGSKMKSGAEKARGSQNGDGGDDVWQGKDADGNYTGKEETIVLEPADISGEPKQTEAKRDNTNVDISNFNLRPSMSSLNDDEGFPGIALYGGASSSAEALERKGEAIASIDVNELLDYFNAMGKKTKKNASKYNPYNSRNKKDPFSNSTNKKIAKYVKDVLKEIYNVDVETEIRIENEGTVEEKVYIDLRFMNVIIVNDRSYNVGDTTVLDIHAGSSRHPDAIILDTITPDGGLGLEYTGTYSPSHGHGRPVVKVSDIGFIKK